MTLEQVVTKVHRLTCERERAEEELALLAVERACCLTFLAEQEAAISNAIQRTSLRKAALEAPAVDVPCCSSFQHRQPTNPAERFAEANYCAGLIMLLSNRLLSCRRQLSAAQSAFLSGNWDRAAEVAAVVVDYEEEEDEAAL